MTAHTKERALERIQALSGCGLDVQSFFDEATEALSAAVPNNGGTGINPFWYTLDPASMLITSMVGICDMPIEDVIQFEYVDDDFNKAVDVGRNPQGIQTLKEATGGDPSRSRTYREYMQPLGIEQEALVALRTRRGDNWGTVRLVRARSQEEFSEDDLDFLRVLSPHLAEGARRGLLTGEATEPEGPDAPGLVVLAEDYSVLWMTPAGEELLEELGGEVVGGGPLPTAVLSVAAQAMAIAGGDEPPDGVAMARVRSQRGRWFALHGAALATTGRWQAPVIIEPDRPARIAPLLMALFGLTPREQEITRYVLQGDSTARIAADLHLSPHTVQQHLKGIFEKTGVRSRRGLVAKVFATHYDPRVRDNDHRQHNDKLIRGGPFPHRKSNGDRT
ncbi:MAG: helix-turn-helix transcriptional regulator [Actinomycetota bacterium]|nr:helix-turn-helix transcriptional regulator [Actinomycetota bacterium]